MEDALKGIDFAALDTLLLVNRHMSFTATAIELGVKQSSVSYTIDKLRKSFNDPLFVRQGNKIFPTERCKDVVVIAERIIGEIEHAMLPTKFDPASVEANITISVTYLSRSVLLPKFIQEMRTQAPGIRVDLITGFTDAGQHLISGSADMALSPVEINESGIYGKFLFEDPYICLMDPNNELAKQEMTLEKFAAASHLIIHYGQKWQPPFRKIVQDQGLEINTVISTANPEDVELLVPGTDLIVTMPSRIAQKFSTNFVLKPCPAPSAAQLNFYWPARLNNSPLQTWLREKIIRLAGQVK